MGELNFNIYNIIIFSGIIQGLIFSSVVLFNRKYRSLTNSFIAITVLVLSLSNLQYWIMDVGFKGILSIFDKLRIPCDMLIVPSFYLYVISYLQEKVSLRLIYFFLIPFALALVFNLFYYYDLIFTPDGFINVNIALESFSLLFNLTLIVMILMKIFNYEKTNKFYNKRLVRVETKWLKHILYIGGIMCLFWIAEIIYMQSSYNKGGLSIYYPLWISISFLVYWISYVGIFNSKIHKERLKIRSIILPKESLAEKHIKKSNDKLFVSIKNWIEDEKKYLNPDLNLGMVANQFNISNGYLSQLLNKHNDLNFNDYINSLRIIEAKEMLKNSSFDNYTITAIGLEAGFNSKSSFYSSFKKFVKLTPSQYKKSVRNY
ncbi:AraC family transcriptional regulator [uncultured Psychroserpens sp.]|uniref:helix-turn-helix domain-containing protein n=1 Tax=uncultured Psychroserpens sp. TaxID=255436 RepID=UPI002615009A|nr:helix-turn-helix domain-containing protein [uncultured Psychroserpens sp.]